MAAELIAFLFVVPRDVLQLILPKRPPQTQPVRNFIFKWVSHVETTFLCSDSLSRDSGVPRSGFRCSFLPTKYENRVIMTPGSISYPTPFPSQFLLVLPPDLLRLISTQLMTHSSTGCLRLLLSRPLVLVSNSVAMFWCCHVLSGFDDNGSQPFVGGLSTST